MSKAIQIGLLGVGNVGTGVVRILSGNAKQIHARLGAAVEVKRILVRDVDKTRDATVAPGLLTHNPRDVLDDPAIQIVVELVGGTTDARDFVLAALRGGKHVVTANKALLAEHGDEIFALADRQNLDVLYEAAVGGGVPIIRTLREALASDRIDSIVSIINGTSNYILTEMTERSRHYRDVLKDAQRLGLAEADPSFDVDGHDAAQKLSILCGLAFGLAIKPKDIFTAGLNNIEPEDIKLAREFGFIIKPLAILREHRGQIEARVHPALVPKDDMLASVAGPLNAFFVHSYALGPSIYVGHGAGPLPTGSAVVSDLIELGRNIRLKMHRRIPPTAYATKPSELQLLPMGEVRCPHYLRFSVADKPGVLAQIAGVLGENNISIAAVLQREQQPDINRPVSVLIMTHEAREADVSSALKRIRAFDIIKGPARHIRIMSAAAAVPAEGK